MTRNGPPVVHGCPWVAAGRWQQLAVVPEHLGCWAASHDTTGRCVEAGMVAVMVAVS